MGERRVTMVKTYETHGFPSLQIAMLLATELSNGSNNAGFAHSPSWSSWTHAFSVRRNCISNANAAMTNRTSELGSGTAETA